MTLFTTPTMRLLTCLLALLLPLLASASLAPYEKLSPKTQPDQLREALFGGKPTLLFCKDEKISQDPFITSVRQKLVSLRKDDQPSDVKVILVDCEQPLSTGSKKSIKDALKLKYKKGSTVGIIWAVNGQKPVELDVKYYVTFLKDANGKATGEVKLNPSKLARYALKYGTAKVLKMTSSKTFKEKCVNSKYLSCIIAVYDDLLATKQTQVIDWIARTFRSFRVFTLDIKTVDFSLLDKLPNIIRGIPQLVVLKQRERVLTTQLFHFGAQPVPMSVHPAFEDDPDTCASADNAQASEDGSDIEDENPECVDEGKSDVRVHLVEMSKSLKELVKLPNGTDNAQIHATFDDSIIGSTKQMSEGNYKLISDLEERRQLAFRITMKKNAELHHETATDLVSYFLDWNGMEPYFVSQTIYSKRLSLPKIGSLQQKTWALHHQQKQKSGKRKVAGVSAKAFRGNTLDYPGVTEFLNDVERGAIQLLPLAKIPTVAKKKLPGADKPKKKKPSSTAKKSKSKASASFGSSKKKTTKGGATSPPTQEQVELERQKRREMEEEERQHFAQFNPDAAGDAVDADDDDRGGDEDEEVIDLDDEEDVIDLDDDEEEAGGSMEVEDDEEVDELDGEEEVLGDEGEVLGDEGEVLGDEEEDADEDDF